MYKSLKTKKKQSRKNISKREIKMCQLLKDLNRMLISLKLINLSKIKKIYLELV